jgi:hypothetical protein
MFITSTENHGYHLQIEHVGKIVYLLRQQRTMAINDRLNMLGR